MNPHLQYVPAQQHLDELRRDAERARTARQFRRPQRHAGVKTVITWIGALVRRPDPAPGELLRPARVSPRPAGSEPGRC